MTITMAPSLRKFALTAHVTFSVGLLGSIATFLALAITGLISQDAQMVRSAYSAMDVIARFVIVPLAFASLLTGVIQSLGTSWGLFRHYWVLVKLLLTAFATIILVVKMELIGYAARLAEDVILPRADLHAAGLQLAVHAAGGLLVLLVPAILSMYKPWGLTPYGRHRQQEQRTQSRCHTSNLNGNTGVRPASDGSTISKPRRAYVLGFIVIVVAVHVVILHLASGGPGHYH